MMQAALPDRSPPHAMPARNIRFFDDPIAQRWYMGRDPVRSAFFSALSATFPLGEQFFIDSVRPWQGALEAKLAGEVNAFIVQEALHTREHLVCNELIAATGYAAAAMEERTREVLAPYRKASSLRQLGLTIALEHFTALFAHAVLTRPELLEDAPAEVVALWRWHAMEEIEHKAVAFDVFMAVTSRWSRLRRYAFRTRALVEATWVLMSVVARNMTDLFAQDDLPQPATWKRAIGYFFGWRGVLTRMAGGYFAWLRPGFHPWQHDDLAIAQAVARDLQPASGA
jgi:hypothetical protein